jgi:hypothetical protein
VSTLPPVDRISLSKIRAIAESPRDSVAVDLLFANIVRISYSLFDQSAKNWLGTIRDSVDIGCVLSLFDSPSLMPAGTGYRVGERIYRRAANALLFCNFQSFRG